MAQALAVDRVVRVSVNLQPKAAPRRNFGVLCIAGSSAVIDQVERVRYYTGLDGVAGDFGLAAPEYKAASLFFAQSPRPYILAVGRFVRENAPARLVGGLVADADLDAAGWSAIADGSFGIVINGSGVTVSGLNFSLCTNMNGVAEVISAKLAQDGARCLWEGDHFAFTTLNSGAEAEIGFAVAAGAGTDLSARLAIDKDTALTPVQGMDAETPLECAAELADSGEWYGLAFADRLADEDIIEVSGFIEASQKSRILLATTTDSRALSASFTGDLASKLKALKRLRSFSQYSKNPHSAISAAGRAFTVNFSANRSTITLKFKQAPGVVAEALKETQAKALEGKNCNVFVNYDNDTAILQEGVMANGAFFDEVHGLDWLQNAVQTECWNVKYQSKTKIPQTDGGVGQIIATITKVFREAVKNGLIAPGVWNADGFGELERGDYLPEGFYIYAPSVDEQAQSEREKRVTPPIQCAVKLAGAIHFTDIQIDVNR